MLFASFSILLFYLYSLPGGSLHVPSHKASIGSRRVWKGSAQSRQGLGTRPMLSLQLCSTLPTQPGSPCPAMMQMRLFLLGTWHSREHSLLGARAASPPHFRALTDAAVLTLQAFRASLLSLSLIATWEKFVGIIGAWTCKRNLLQVIFSDRKF